MTLFDILKDIITTKSGTLHTEPDFKSVWSSYMVCRYLSMDSRFFPIAENFNKLYLTMTNKQAYLYLTKAIPQNRNSFIRYISKPKK